MSSLFSFRRGRGKIDEDGRADDGPASAGIDLCLMGK